MTDAFHRSLRGSAVVALALALAACSGKPGPQAVSSTPTVAPSATSGVIDLLNQGNEKDALKQIKAMLKRDPNDVSAKVLQDSIKIDPVTLLGPKSFAYTTQAGDTMIGLSERFLGNKIKFYELARYNHVAVPASLAAGTVLRIPGEPPRPPAPPEPVSRPSEPIKPAKSTRPKSSASKPAAAVPAANPAAALKLRGAGLAALNQGKVAQAVGLLRKAASLDPANPLIARDLARAERIAQTVQSHR